MTTQIMDYLRDGDQGLSLASDPLKSKFFIFDQPRFEVTSSNNWRGYVASWEISDGKLWLTGITGTLVGGEEDVWGNENVWGTLFPGQGDKIFADWYFGTLVCPIGRPLRRANGCGYDYEQKILYDVENGYVIGKSEINATTD